MIRITRMGTSAGMAGGKSSRPELWTVCGFSSSGRAVAGPPRPPLASPTARTPRRMRGHGQSIAVPRGLRRVARHPTVRAVVLDESLKVGQQRPELPISLQRMCSIAHRRLAARMRQGRCPALGDWVRLKIHADDGNRLVALVVASIAEGVAARMTSMPAATNWAARAGNCSYLSGRSGARIQRGSSVQARTPVLGDPRGTPSWSVCFELPRYPTRGVFVETWALARQRGTRSPRTKVAMNSRLLSFTGESVGGREGTGQGSGCRLTMRATKRPVSPHTNVRRFVTG
jgi:hypothetical protein